MGKANAVRANAVKVYGLIHARFIQTSKGLHLMKEKYQKGHFGTCPRVLCSKQHVLPFGPSDELGKCSVKLYCPRCQGVYDPPEKVAQTGSKAMGSVGERKGGSGGAKQKIDGAFFGSSFPHIFHLNYPSLGDVPAGRFVPKIYGFRLHKTSPVFPKQYKYDYYNDAYVPSMSPSSPEKALPNGESSSPNSNKNEAEEENKSPNN